MMEQNIILAGVGGQGILTIARAIAAAALHRDLHLKQAEVHGMSQRGGAVQSHLRVADHELFSDLIPAGQTDIVFAVEPLEALRYVQYLKADGVIIASTNAFVNIENYPAIEQVLERIAQFPRHILVDADGLAKAAGSVRAANIVTLGAGSHDLSLDPQELEDAVAEMFAGKGEQVVAVNRRAFRLGRNAAAAYRLGLEKGGTSRMVRAWLDTLKPEELLSDEPPAPPAFDDIDLVAHRLTGAEATAFERTLLRAYEEERRPLYEHEVYMLIELVGAISPPRYVFVPRDELISAEALERFPGDRVVLKLVSQDVTHKSDAGGLVFVPKEYETVKREMERLMSRFNKARVAGVLVVECVEQAASGLGSELFVGVRATREFGPVIVAGLGGVDTEYIAQKLPRGQAIATALAMDTTAEEFLAQFSQTTAYELLAGRVRGHKRLVSDGDLLRCFRAFISIARHFCVDRGATGPDIAELEVNPFAFRQERLLPLDGRGRLGTQAKPLPARPADKVTRMLEPRSIAVLGVSGTGKNFGRIILNNIQQCGFANNKLVVIKDGQAEIDGVRCVAKVSDLPAPVDLLVVAAPASAMPDLSREIVASGKVGAAIVIPGGLGETEGSSALEQQVRDAIAAGRANANGGTVFLGPNCMGVQSRPGNYDTFFIPQAKLDSGWGRPARRVALVSQSGAFIVARRSNLTTLDPAITISLGNQIDITLADCTRAVAQRDDIDVVGVYAEGFSTLDGLELTRVIRQATQAGKVVVFYKAGRTASGRSAAAGHTASLAGDYDVCAAAAAQAGALVAGTLREFEDLLRLSAALHGRRTGGQRVAVLSNAGFETVAMADNVTGAEHAVTLTELDSTAQAQLRQTLAQQKLDTLVNPRNPLDLTPMASDAAYRACAAALIGHANVDAVVASLVPLTPAMLTTGAELQQPGNLAEQMLALWQATDKPLVVCIDGGPLYDELVQQLERAGLVVFRRCDEAVRTLGRYLMHREAWATGASPAGAVGRRVRNGAPVPTA